MNATFTHKYFLRMAHTGFDPPFSGFTHQVSLPLDPAHRCLMI
jgi:hypothetical protein